MVEASRFIPNQLLENPHIRFTRIKKGAKNPIDNDWAKTGNWKSDSQELLSHLENGGNYGVCGGYADLIIIDCDTPDMYRDVYEYLPKTLTVKSGREDGGRHFYFYCSEIKKSFNISGEKGLVASVGKQVVGAGSLHPNGNRYKVIEDTPIATITEDQLKDALKNWMIKDFEEKLKIERKKENNTNDLISIPLEKIIGHLLPNDNPLKSTYNIPHPVHGSTNGKNFYVNLEEKLWYCYRCGVGGDGLQLIGLLNGIITCSSNGNLKLKGDDFIECVKIANEKYNMNIILQKKAKLKLEGLNLIEQDVLSFIQTIQPVYYDKSQIWWIWNQERLCYERVDETDIINSIRTRLGIVGMNESTLKNQYLEAFRQASRLQAPIEMQRKWIQFRNTIIDVSRYPENDIRLITPESKYFLSNPLPRNFINDPYIECPKIDKYFEDWVGKEWKQTLYEIIGYCMLPEFPIATLFFLLGSGRNGKSTFLKLLRRVVGVENICSTTLERLDESKSRFGTASLYKKLVCSVGEVNFGILKNTNILKAITGEDLVPAEFKGKEEFSFENYSKPIIATNSLPVNLDKSDGWWRRAFVIDFPNQFNDIKDVMGDISDEEVDALASKCLFALMNVLRSGKFTNQGTIKERERRYEERSNPVIPFIKERYVIDMNGSVICKQFLEELNGYIQSRGGRKLELAEVTDVMGGLGYYKERDSRVINGEQTKYFYYFGLKEKTYTQKDIFSSIYNSQNTSIIDGNVVNLDTVDTVDTVSKSVNSPIGQLETRVLGVQDVQVTFLDLIPKSGDCINILDLERSALLNGWKIEDIDDIMKLLERQGKILSPRAGFWRRM